MDSIRGWLDKIICALAVMLLGLATYVWASQQSQIDSMFANQQDRERRVIRLEQQQIERDNRFDRIDKRLERIESKVDILLTEGKK
jgi:TolA-binding protein